VECSVYACISRSALEAIACAKPVILCGDYGWAGRFTRENAERCEATNFTLRGFGYPENINQSLLDEILFCLNNPDNIKSDCEYGAAFINNKYSVKKMAGDVYSVYQKAELKYKDYDFVLGGYYGSNNIGDDALLFLILSNIFKLKNNLKVCVITKNPGKMQKYLDNYFANIVTRWKWNFPGMQKSIKKSRALVFGGGTLLQDLTSSRSLGYYLWLLKTARKFNKKAVLYANGIGPLYNIKNQEKVKKIIEHISLATMRDEDSYNQLIKLGMAQPKVYLTADEAVTIKDYNMVMEKEDFKEFIKNKYVVVSVRRWQGLSLEFFEKFAAAVDNICREHNLTPVYIVMRPKDDRAVSQKLADLNSRAYVADTGGDLGKILAIIKSAEAVISMRLHALIFASAFNVPMIGVCYDQKVRSFLELIYENNHYLHKLILKSS
jgi:polysaccharide pyruvyl transferase CsaB